MMKYKEQTDANWAMDQKTVEDIWAEKDKILFKNGVGTADEKIKQEIALIKRFRNHTDVRTEYVR